ncbi:uncharacterized protein LACBIDRAFT_329694 [Laccaria bicolor S238N-H82]|uniref:Predicted protein n=1 Tax=Laccaria bicolor (strain S238N-H82 / ATCC MYA-4686) TaxID=486041 RepID=B0DIW3_LACBS|nr:uncharacterized protein LACBIDRAFT_329694 [Laccaria bicolor S238N-H82]EDR05301.1 predicted protein [Laccaria bicolor S238N-H82]|eukprot:XP_001883859.1 predicted protein [Laccaria bicolor S238N-H82]
MPYDIRPRLTYKTPPTQPKLKRTPTRITFTQLNPFIAHLGPLVFIGELRTVSRAKSTEEIEQSVPSVLDSAASILASIDDSHPEEQVSVEPPCLSEQWPLSFRSRSPSPLGARNITDAGVPVHNLLLSPHAPHTTFPVVGRIHPPSFQRSGLRSRHRRLCSSSSSSPTMTTAQEHPLASLPEPDDGDVGAGDETEDSAKGRKRKAQAKGKEESRCEKIANLLVEGKKGADLEKAVSLSAVPLTHMFKRSLSLPSSNPRSTLPAITITLPSDATSPGDGEASRMGTPGTPSLRRPPYSQRDTAALFPLLCTPFTSYGPRHLQSEDEEARRRSELSQKGWYWWLSSGLEDQIADSGCERPMIADGMGYEDPVGQYDYQYIEQYDRRPSLDPIPPPVSTDPSNYFYTSPSAPLPASSFSTLSGWAGDYKYDETSHRQTSSAVNATVSAPIPAWYEAPGWEAHEHQFNHPSLYFSPDDWDRIEVNHEEDRHIGRRS